MNGLKARYLGHEDCSRIGFGTWGLGGDAYGPADDRESERALRRAFDLGIFFYDTADIYGTGRSEQLLGRVFSKIRSSVVIATKLGYQHYGTRKQDFSENALKQSLTRSLRRLRSEYVDVLFLHSPPREVACSEKVFQTLATLQAEGKIVRTGVSVRTAGDGIAALQRLTYGAVEVNFNLLWQEARTTGLLKMARAERVVVVAKAPLCYGLLAGDHFLDRNSAQDHRSRFPGVRWERWREQCRKFDCLANCGAKTKVQMALQFCMALGAMPIPGMRVVSHVDENYGAVCADPLAPEDVDAAIRLYDEIQTQSGISEA